MSAYETFLSRQKDKDVDSCVAYFYIPHISVELDLNDSQYTPAEPLSCPCVYIRSKEGDTYGELPTPERHGYTFQGWYTARSGRRMRGPIQPDWVLSSYYDHTVYAMWSGNPTKTTASIYDAKNNRWLSGGRDTIVCYTSPKLSAVEETPHHLSSCTLSTDYSLYCYAYVDNTNYTALCLGGTGEWYTYDYDLQKGVYAKHDTPYVFTEGGDYSHYTGYIYPANNIDLTVFVWPKRTLTYLPMYLSANGLLLRGVKSILPIRDA